MISLIARLRALLLSISCVWVICVPASVNAQFISDNKSTQDLEYGSVLFEYFQKNYFEALIEQEYAQAIDNSIAKDSSGQILKGGMLLSYGMPDASKKIFEQLLSSKTTEEINNKAWFYLAKMLYAKSDLTSAQDAISRIKGKVPDEIYTEYNYLVLLIANGSFKGNRSASVSEDILKTAQKDTPYYPYLLFNTAIVQLRNNQLKEAVINLEKVTEYSGKSEELSVLADRARHGLAELAIKYNRLDEAWNYLKPIRTQGLYSNRALLSYAWAAINLKRYGEAIPALEMLNTRSIAIPEVQEAIVLLAHVYEQEGLLKKALQANLNAEKNYDLGIKMLAEARDIIDKQDVPREFISNIEAMIDDSDWFNTKPSVDYKKLTPFLIDLMAGYQFRETLDELADLYAMEENLNYWSLQAEQHSLILKTASQKTYDSSVKDLLDKGSLLKEQFSEKNSELKLFSLSLSEREQERLNSLMQSTDAELNLLNDKMDKLAVYKIPYKQPLGYESMVAEHHVRIKQLLIEIHQHINKFELIMRGLVKNELDEHEKRMKFYAAQSKLAKARLYDLMLLSLENPKSTTNSKVSEGKNQ
jgi:hypothetical protein